MHSKLILKDVLSLSGMSSIMAKYAEQSVMHFFTHLS